MFEDMTNKTFNRLTLSKETIDELQAKLVNISTTCSKLNKQIEKNMEEVEGLTLVLGQLTKETQAIHTLLKHAGAIE